MSTSIKSQLRNLIKERVKLLSQDSLLIQSQKVTEKLLNLEEIKNSECVSIYIPKKFEIDSLNLLKVLLDLNKNILVPKVIGQNPSDMLMIKLNSFNDILSFPKNKWGIPEPEYFQDNQVDIANIDVVIVPGVGFDPKCNRLGHGKGYYDYFINELIKIRSERGLKTPVLIGLSLEEQIIDQIPIDSHDRSMNYVISQFRTFRQFD